MLNGVSSMTAAQPRPVRVFCIKERRAVELRMVVPQFSETKKKTSTDNSAN
jgi:hypothetical protein